MTQLKSKLAEQKARTDDMERLGKQMAKNTHADELVRLVRNQLKNAKRKRLEGRIQAKNFIMEFVLSNKIVIPEDLMEEINALDDEVAVQAKVVNNNYAGDITLQAGSTLNGNINGTNEEPITERL